MLTHLQPALSHGHALCTNWARGPHTLLPRGVPAAASRHYSRPSLLPSAKSLRYTPGARCHMSLLPTARVHYYLPRPLPSVTPIMYNPGATEGSRYTVLNNTNIARSYHSNICQHTTGEVCCVHGHWL